MTQRFATPTIVSNQLIRNYNPEVRWRHVLSHSCPKQRSFSTPARAESLFGISHCCFCCWFTDKNHIALNAKLFLYLLFKLILLKELEANFHNTTNSAHNTQHPHLPSCILVQLNTAKTFYSKKKNPC